MNTIIYFIGQPVIPKEDLKSGIEICSGKFDQEMCSFTAQLTC